MQWINGAPDETGLWLVESRSGELEVWTVELDADDDPSNYVGTELLLDENDLGPEYLRMHNHDGSEPVDDYAWPPVRSFGPIPLAGAKTHAIHSARVQAPPDITKPRPHFPREDL